MAVIKFLHLLLAIGLLSLTAYCFAYLDTPYKLQRINKVLLLICPFAMLTGALLVHPKQFTFHTPWVQAAFALLSFFCFGIVLLMFFKKISRWFSIAIYLFLLTLLILITHDAVTKTSFIIG